MDSFEKVVLAKTGSNDADTHFPVRVGQQWKSLAALFTVEAVGSTPTVTWRVQGSHSYEYESSVAASLSTSMTGANNDVTLTSKLKGAGGNAYSLTLVNPGALNPTIDVSLAANGVDVTVTLAHNGSAITTTASQLVEALNTTPDVSALIAAVVKAGDNGTGIVTALSKTQLSGGSDSGAWFDALYVTDSTDTVAVASRTVTTVGGTVNYLVRPFPFLRLVTSSNTNVTYRAEAFLDRSI